MLAYLRGVKYIRDNNDNNIIDSWLLVTNDYGCVLAMLHGSSQNGRLKATRCLIFFVLQKHDSCIKNVQVNIHFDLVLDVTL